MNFEGFLNKPLKEKLQSLTKEEIIDILVSNASVFRYISRELEDYAVEKFLNKESTKREKLLEESNKATKEYTSYISYLKAKYNNEYLRYSEITTDELDKLFSLQQEMEEANKRFIACY